MGSERGADSDLTPPEELHGRRIRRRVLIAALLVAALLAGLYFAAHPASQAIKSWQSRRLAREASVLIDAAQWQNATAKVRDAYQLDPRESESWRVMARLLTRTNQSSAALSWWTKLNDRRNLTVADRREFAHAAIAAGNLSLARTQIEQLFAEAAGAAPADMLLAAQLESLTKKTVRVRELTEKVMADSRATSNEVLAAAVLALSHASPESPLYRTSWNHIARLAEDPRDPASLEAIVTIAKRPPAADQATVSRPTVATLLENHPKAQTFHQLLALELRALDEPARVPEFISQAIERFGSGDEETLAALGAWLYARGQFDKMLELIPTERALRDRALYLQHIDALAALGRLQEVKELLTSDRFPLEPSVKHMYLATTRSRLGEVTGATNDWQRALEAADSPTKLFSVARYAERHRAAEVADSAYARVLNIDAKSRDAYHGRLRLAEARGHTATLQTIAAEMVRQWPEDERIRNDEAYLRLLLGASGEEAQHAEDRAASLVSREPEDWPALTTLALSRLRLGRPADALSAFAGVHEYQLNSAPRASRAIYAATLAANGENEEARQQANELKNAHLLPEERALIAPLCD